MLGEYKQTLIKGTSPMRLGKRERARLRLERAQALAYRSARDKIVVIAPASPDIHMSMYGRLKPVLRPVNTDNGRKKPHYPSWANGQTARKRANSCPKGEIMLPDTHVKPSPSKRKALAPRWSNPRLV